MLVAHTDAAPIVHGAAHRQHGSPDKRRRGGYPASAQRRGLVAGADGVS